MAESRELSSLEEDKFSLEEIKTRVKSQAIRYLKTMGKGASSRQEAYIVLQLLDKAKNFTEIFEYLFNLVRTATVAERQQAEAELREREVREAVAAARREGQGRKQVMGTAGRDRSLQRIE
jgi:hypothetical protein